MCWPSDNCNSHPLHPDRSAPGLRDQAGHGLMGLGMLLGWEPSPLLGAGMGAAPAGRGAGGSSSPNRPRPRAFRPCCPHHRRARLWRRFTPENPSLSPLLSSCMQATGGVRKLSKAAGKAFVNLPLSLRSRRLRSRVPPVSPCQWHSASPAPPGRQDPRSPRSPPSPLLAPPPSHPCGCLGDVSLSRHFLILFPLQSVRPRPSTLGLPPSRPRSRGSGRGPLGGRAGRCTRCRAGEPRSRAEGGGGGR